MADPTFEKGPTNTPEGAPNTQQLPQGGATQLNDQTAAGQQSAQQQASQQGPGQGAEEPEPVVQGDQRVQFSPKSEEERYLYSANPGPSSSPFAGLNRSFQPPPPKELMDALPAFQAAATLPGAPPQMHALIALIVHHAKKTLE